MTEGLKYRSDLVGQLGTVTRRITVIDAREGEDGVDIRITDNMGNTYWTALDDDISLN